jgi:hypothetical protein
MRARGAGLGEDGVAARLRRPAHALVATLTSRWVGDQSGALCAEDAEIVGAIRVGGAPRRKRKAGSGSLVSRPGNGGSGPNETSSMDHKRVCPIRDQ